MEESIADLPLPGPFKLAIQMESFRLRNFVDRDALDAPENVADGLITVLNAMLFVAMCLRAGFEYPEWAQGVVRTMGADTAAPGAIRALVAALPVSLTSDPEVAS